jgi:hypothetical protein
MALCRHNLNGFQREPTSRIGEGWLIRADYRRAGIRGIEPKVSHTLHMLGLRKHIKRHNIHQAVDLIAAQNVQVPRQRGRLTGDIQNLGWTLREQAFQSGWMASPPWGIKDDGGFACRKTAQHSRQPLLDGAGNDLPVGAVAGRRIGARGEHRAAIVLNAGKGNDMFGQFNPEETNSTVGVDEMTNPAVSQPIGNRLDQGGEKLKVILEKRIRWHFPIGWRQAQRYLQTAARRWIGSQLAQFTVERRIGNGAFLHVHDQAVIVSQEAKDKPLMRLVPLTADQDPVAVMVGGGAGDNRLHWVDGKPADAADQLGDLALFDLELGRVIQMLVLAAAACAEIWTTWHNPVGRGFKDLHQPGASELFFDFGNLSFNDFAWNDKRDKNDQRMVACNAFTAECKVINGQAKGIASLDGDGRGSGGGGHGIQSS